jgi:hypothetical protein
LIFKDPNKRFTLEASQQPGYFKNYRINHFGFGILKRIKEKILKQREITALIILLVCHRKWC